MNKLEEAREIINEVDAQMAQLFEKRMGACKMVAEYKKEHGLSIKDTAREAALIEKCKSNVKDGEIESYYVEFQKKAIELSCRYQSAKINGMRVAFCGVEGAYAHIAAKKMFPEGEAIAYKSFQEAYESVENGENDIAVLPLENSYAGEVGTVMDMLFSGNLYINQVYDLPIRHNLLVNSGVKAEEIKKVISHPQALDQCAKYIAKHGYESESCSNTAVAAKTVKEKGDNSLAAIASDETANIFGLDIIESGINDRANNTTRFGAFSRSQNLPHATSKRGNETFILVFTCQNRAGALAQTLNIIGAHGYNMRALRSRPTKDLQWSYFFYIEAEGNVNNENGRDMMRELSAICARLKLVGAFLSE